MGMYDYVNCECPLPDGKTFPPYTLQTKAFDCLLDAYTITADGKIQFHPSWLHDYYAAYGIFDEKLANNKDISQYHGEIQFHANYGDVHHSYIARFTSGELEWIKAVERK